MVSFAPIGARLRTAGAGVAVRAVRALAVTATLVLILIACFPRPAHAATAAGEMAAEAAASALAQRAGTSVPVAGDTTEQTQVEANSDGTFTLTSSPVPVRVEQNGTWTAIDTDLVRNADGTYSPKAAAAQMAFSGGGIGPLVKVSHGAESVSMDWPGTLPVPTVSLNTVTYQSVLPGVDLELAAFADHYTETLVVANAAAAANPALATLKLGLSGTGVALSHQSDGSTVGSDTSGAVVFKSERPVMWDSTLNPGLGPAPTASDPGGANQTPIPSSMAAAPSSPGSSTLTLTPPASALTGAGVTYPLYIDPSFGTGINVAVQLFSDGYHTNTPGDFEVGYCGWAGCNGVGVGRSFFMFPTGPLSPTSGVTAHVFSATVQVWEYWNADGCQGQPNTIWSSGAVNGSTGWGGPLIANLGTFWNNDSTGCSTNPPGWSTWSDSGGAITQYAQQNANGGWGSLTFGLLAQNESNAYQWKRFSDGGNGPGPQLTVTYDFPPNTPNVWVGNTFTCGGVHYLPQNPPALYGTANDPNPSDSEYLTFQINNSANQYVSSGTSGWVSSNAQASWTGGALGDGNYSAYAYATSNGGGQSSGWSGGWPFTVETEGATPLPAPTVGSFTDPAGYWGQPSGTLTLAAASANVVGFAYAIDSQTVILPSNAQCAPYASDNPTAFLDAQSSGSSSETATLTLPALGVGEHTLYVRDFDAAHNASAATTTYSFWVGASLPGTTSGIQQAESNAVTVSSGDYAYVEAGAQWSGGYREHLVADAPYATFDFPITVAANAEGDYALGAGIGTAPDFACLEFSITPGTTTQNPDPITTQLAVQNDPNGCDLQDQGLAFDAYSANPGTALVQLGVLHMAPGPYTVSVQMIAADTASTSVSYSGGYGGAGGYPTVCIPGPQQSPCSTQYGYPDGGYSAGLDYFLVQPINAATYPNLGAAMNNAGIATDNQATTASLDMTPARDNLSSSALAAATMAAGQTVSVDSGTPYAATFVMPSATNGYDNVVTDGQVIDLPGSGYNQTVDLLVAATCSTTPYSESISTTLDLNVVLSNSNGPTMNQDVPMPSVPQWLGGSLSANGLPATPVSSGGLLYKQGGIAESFINTAATLAQYDQGATATPTTSGQPGIYHVQIFVQADPGYAATQIVLPYYGTTFTDNCSAGNPALHVLAISGSNA